MAKWTHIQNDFSAGELSPKMSMRQDEEVYLRGVKEMTNFLPTPQGTALRMPGTRHLLDTGANTGRIIPYLTSANERSLVLLGHTTIKLLTNVNDFINGEISAADLGGGGGVISYTKPIVPNDDFDEGQTDWVIDPGWVETENDNGKLGAVIVPSEERIYMSVRYYKWPTIEPTTVIITNEGVVDVASDTATIQFDAEYMNGGGGPGAGGLATYDMSVKVVDKAAPTVALFEKTWDQGDYDIGDLVQFTEIVPLPTAGWLGTLEIVVTLESKQGPGTKEYPKLTGLSWNVYQAALFAKGEATLDEVDLVTPYLGSELNDVQYVQSPYEDKELVFTHPNHPPHWLKFDVGLGAYVFEPIVFTNQPAAWQLNNYPASCTSAVGRLVLGGGQTFRVSAGDPIASVSESIWATKPGEWDQFTIANFASPGDSFYLETTFRSPIQWMYGHKDLIVGAQEFEYTVRLGLQGSGTGTGPSADSELWASLNSTNGSVNIQPAGFGDGVMFAADGGRRIRYLKYSDQDGGWTTADITLLNPEITQRGIVRMSRIRSPQQMLGAVNKQGQLCLFSMEKTVEGWCRYNAKGAIKDFCVLSDDEGRDVPYFLTSREVAGVRSLYLEAIPDFGDPLKWLYPSSHVAYDFDTPTDTLTGLDHLEGQGVQVWEKFRFLGAWTVVGGSITLDNDYGGTYLVTKPVVGMGQLSRIVTMPIPKDDPGAIARFSKVGVRTYNSTRPIINGQRPADRTPATPLGKSQKRDRLHDVDVGNIGSDLYQEITIEEQIPERCEILGVYGQVEANNT
jgi:hypothetical protein